jgi:hypothetical protein
VEQATTTASDPKQDWPAWVSEEFEKNQGNGCVGTRLLSETERVRIWEIRLKPGERIGFHCHVLDYFWTAVTAGRARSRIQNGTTVETSYFAGETQHSKYGHREYKVHDLENIGDSELIFTTVEFLDSANEALPIPLSGSCAHE